MDFSRFPETTESLIAAAAEAAFAVSGRNIAEWHRAGLLPLPTVEHRGKPQGNLSHYPAEARARLLAFLPCRSGRRLRPVPELLWRLFAAEFDIEEQYLRPHFVRYAGQFDQYLSLATQLAAEDAAGKREAAAGLAEVASSLTRDRIWRRRFGYFVPPTHYEQVIEMLGGDRGAGRQLLQAIAPSFGETAATEDQVTGLREVLATMRRGSFRAVAVDITFAELRDTTVDLARQARRISAGLDNPVVSAILGVREPGLNVLQGLFSELYHPLFVLWILAERRYAPTPVIGPALRALAALAGPQ